MSKHQRIAAPAAAKVARRNGRGGAGRVRAHDDDEKEARRQDILDAADQLYAVRQELANMADVAEAAGLAKGTVYLYFQSKEELYLALHLRHAGNFFAELIAYLDGSESFDFGGLRELTNRHILEAPGYLPLGASCIGFPAAAVRPEVAAHFQARFVDWLSVGGAGLERHFKGLPRGEGARLLQHSYAIMIGLYGLMRGEHSGALVCPGFAGQGSLQEEIALALQRYWAQVAGTDGASDAEHALG